MSIYQILARLEAEGSPVALCTIVRTEGSTPRHTGSKMLVFPDGTVEGTVGGGEMEARVVAEAIQAMADGQPRILYYEMADPKRGDPGVCGGQLEVFVEPVSAPATLVIVGGGHVGRAVAHIARWLDYRVIISDDRPEYCTPEAVPDGDAYYPVPLEELSDQIDVTPRTYFVLCTRNVEIDVLGLPSILKTPARYIGVIGSKRRWETTRRKLKEVGIPEDQLDRVTSPMGLELNAETPEEIALSILAEITMLRRGGHGEPMAESSKAESERRVGERPLRGRNPHSPGS